MLTGVSLSSIITDTLNSDIVTMRSSDGAE